MTRNKVKHVAISEESTRKSTLSKRTESLFKKTGELSTLCDVAVVAIVQDPKDNDEALWPSREAVEEKLARFLSLPEMEKSKKMFTHESFLLESVRNKYEKNKRLANKNDEREMAHLVKEYISGKVKIQDFDVRQTDGLITYFNHFMKILERKNQALQYLEHHHSQEVQQLEQQQHQELQQLEQQQHQELRQLELHQSSVDLESHSNYYTPFLPQQQQELPFIESSVSASHSLYHPQPQQEQLPPLNTTSSYHASTLDPETMALLSNENYFMETMFDRPNMVDLYSKYHATVGFPQSTSAPGEGNNMGFDQTAGADNIAENYAFPAPPNGNTNSSEGAKIN